jgi:membrane protease YdiL (CAAX protease family)
MATLTVHQPPVSQPTAVVVPVPLRRRKDIATFLLLTFALSAVVWAPIIAAGALDVGGGLYVALGMWCPAVAALATRRLFQRTRGGFGWQPGSPRYLLLGYATPLVLSVLVYGFAWATGLGRFAPAEMAARLGDTLGLGGDLDAGFVLVWFVATGTLLVPLGMLTALGEELGWRGFLVPALSQSTGFRSAALISGAVWAVWHSPVLLFADYNAGTPPWYGLATFSAMVVAASVLYAWLRLRSGSVWPAVLLHASHNAFVQNFFDPLTATTGPTPYVTTEFGLGLALAWLAVAAWAWRHPPAPHAPASARGPRSVPGTDARSPSGTTSSQPEEEDPR